MSNLPSLDRSPSLFFFVLLVKPHPPTPRLISHYPHFLTTLTQNLINLSSWTHFSPLSLPLSFFFLFFHSGVNICPKKSETVYPPIWVFWNCLSCSTRKSVYRNFQTVSEQKHKLSNIINSHCVFNMKETRVCVWVDLLPRHGQVKIEAQVLRNLCPIITLSLLLFCSPSSSHQDFQRNLTSFFRR